MLWNSSFDIVHRSSLVTSIRLSGNTIRNFSSKVAARLTSLQTRQQMVLQVASHEKSVLHAVAAIATLHEKLLVSAAEPAESQGQRTTFALEQCNKSIQVMTAASCAGMI